MKPTLLFLLLSTMSLLADAPWPNVPYQEVRALAWDPGKTPPTEELIRADMSLVEGVIDKAGAVLNADQVKRLLAAEARRFADRPVAGCYNPHNAFVFYNAEKKPVAFLEICFDCLGSRTSPTDGKCDPDFVALAKICAELKLPIGTYKSVEEFQKHQAEIFGVEKDEPVKKAPKAKRK